MESKRLEFVAFSALFIGVSVLAFFVFQPFLGILVLAAILSVLLHPLNEKLASVLGGRKNLVAILLVVVALFFIIIPVLFLGSQIFGQAQSFFSLTQSSQGQYVQSVQQNINVLTQHILPGFSLNLSEAINRGMVFVSNNLGGLLSQTTYLFFQIFFLLFALYFFLRDGEKLLESFLTLSPFGKEQNRQMINSVNKTVTSVIRGTLFVGLIRFALFIAAFYLLGIPHALLWATIGGLVGAIPGIGSPFVVIPAFFYLLLSGKIFLAIGMGLFGVLLILLIDNWLSAYFFGKGLDVPALFVLFSILGGVLLFGPLGFIFGPIVLSLFISAVDMYKILVLKRE